LYIINFNTKGFKLFGNFMIDRPKTKIVATLGPATLDRSSISGLIKAGVSIFRINFSHSTHAQAKELIRNIEASSKETGIPAGIIGDLQGPKIRIGVLSENEYAFTINSRVKIIMEKRSEKADEIPLPEKEVYDSIAPGHRIVLGDGEVELLCQEVHDNYIAARVINAGTIKSNKGLHIPGAVMRLTNHLKKDMDDFKFCLSNNIDYLMLSFVQNKGDIKRFREILDERCPGKLLIGSKIETRSSIENLDEIIINSDFVVVARGDLAIETSCFDIPIHQKSIIEKANKYGIPVIVATQMLESMIVNEEPTRAEISDIANAILDGTDAVMLSGETAVGKHPIKAVQILEKTACKIEGWISSSKETYMRQLISDDRIADAVAKSIMVAGDELMAKCLICTTKTGKTARLLSRYRPKSPILAFTHTREIIKKLLIHWGVYPYEIDYNENFEKLINESVEKAREIYSLEHGDIILYSAGLSDRKENAPQTNFLNIRKIK